MADTSTSNNVLKINTSSVFYGGYLINAQKAGATKFSVSPTGIVTATGNITTTADMSCVNLTISATTNNSCSIYTTSTTATTSNNLLKANTPNATYGGYLINAILLPQLV